MDPDLKAYLEGRFAYLDGQFGELRKDMERRSVDVDRQLAEVRQDVDRQLVGVREDVNRQLAGVREDVNRQLAGVRQDVKEVRQDMESGFAELKDEAHLTRVLVEKLNDKIDLVAEGVQSNTQVMHRLHEESRREHRESRSVMESAIRHLESRTSAHDVALGKLDRRVSALEVRRPPKSLR